MRYKHLQKKVFPLAAEITKHSSDVIMKAMAETFKDKTLEMFGLNTAGIVGIIPTVLPVLEVKENRTDYIFLLADDTLLHLEFQTSVRSMGRKHGDGSEAWGRFYCFLLLCMVKYS